MDVCRALTTLFVLCVTAVSMAEEKLPLFTKQGPIFITSEQKPQNKILRSVLKDIGGFSEIETMLAERAIVGKRQEQINFWRERFIKNTEPVKINTLYSRELMIISNEELWPTLVYTCQNGDDRLEIMKPRREEVKISHP